MEGSIMFVMFYVSYFGLTLASHCPRSDFSDDFKSAKDLIDRNDTSVGLMYNALGQCDFEDKIEVPALKHCRGHCHLQPRCYAFNTSYDPFGCTFCLDFGVTRADREHQNMTGVFIKAPTLHDDCVEIPCDHDGTCTNTPLSYICHCAPGYEGPQCQSNINECHSNPCLNGGYCLDRVAGYECLCKCGTTGIHCETHIDEEFINPCLQGGWCQGPVDSYRCHCLQGTGGNHCELNEIVCGDTHTPQATVRVSSNGTFSNRICPHSNGYWSSKHNDRNPWIEVDMGINMKLVQVVTRGNVRSFDLTDMSTNQTIDMDSLNWNTRTRNLTHPVNTRIVRVGNFQYDGDRPKLRLGLMVTEFN